MNSVDGDVFQEAVARALERMAFVFTAPGHDNAREVLAGPVMHARVGVAGGDETVVFCVTASHDFLVEVASAMMGVEAAAIDIDQHGPAAAIELASTLGGELVMAMGGKQRSLRLGLPRITDTGEARRLVDAGGAVRVLESDGGGRLLLNWVAG